MNKQEKPVIPAIPKPEKPHTPIPGLQEGREMTLSHGASIPMMIIESVSESGMKISQKREMVLVVKKGVTVVSNGNTMTVRANAVSFLGLPFLIAFATACVSIAVVIVLGLHFKFNQTPQPTTPVPQAHAIVTPTLNNANNLIKMEEEMIKVDGLLSEETDELGKVINYEKPSELFRLIADKEGAIKVYEEAVALRKSAAKNENDRSQIRQAIIRLHALLRQSKLPEAYQRHASRQLWIIYHCHLQDFKSAQGAEKMIKKYNERAKPNERVPTICPKDDE
jgi:hypothetical protein